MQVSDVTQSRRRIRALLDSEDLKLLLAKAVAAEAGVELTDPDVRVQSVEVRPALQGVLCATAEVIIEVAP